MDHMFRYALPSALSAVADALWAAAERDTEATVPAAAFPGGART